MLLRLGPPTLSEYSLSRAKSLTDMDGWLDPSLWREDLQDAPWRLLAGLQQQSGEDLGRALLVGWGPAPVPPPRLHEDNYRLYGDHLYAFRLPVAAAGPRVSVPIGAAVMADGGSFSAWALSAIPRADRSTRYLERYREGHDFLLPTGQSHLRHRRLEVQGYLASDPASLTGGAAQLQLWNWSANQWVTVNPRLSRAFRQEVPGPKRFIQMPRGLVQVRVMAGDATRSYEGETEVTWIDRVIPAMQVTAHEVVVAQHGRLGPVNAHRLRSGGMGAEPRVGGADRVVDVAALHDCPQTPADANPRVPVDGPASLGVELAVQVKPLGPHPAPPGDVAVDDRSAWWLPRCCWRRSRPRRR